jgi:hypothetical protein
MTCRQVNAFTGAETSFQRLLRLPITFRPICL